MAHIIYRRAIGVTLTLVVDGRPTWRKVDICGVNGLGIVFIGFDRGLNATNGHPLPSNQGAFSIYLAPGYQLWAIGTDALDEVSVFETTESPDLLAYESEATGRPVLLRSVR